MEPDWSATFERFGLKTVTQTDKTKGAFVVSAGQKDALAAAGRLPGYGGPNALLFDVEVLTEERGPLRVSYYDSVREGAGRTPETRMGREIIHWLSVGDTVGIGNIGKEVFVWKAGKADVVSEIGRRIAKAAKPKDLLKKAREATGKPPRQMRQVADFRRNLAVVGGALSRASGNCEMPSCSVQLFRRDDGRNFLEVHHILPLAEGGEDTMKNAAAVCPMCHRELHFGENRMTKRDQLKSAIVAKEP
jgi:5-methylcytosine-specific restriction endonuclease McrA